MHEMIMPQRILLRLFCAQNYLGCPFFSHAAALIFGYCRGYAQKKHIFPVLTEAVMQTDM